MKEKSDNYLVDLGHYLTDGLHRERAVLPLMFGTSGILFIIAILIHWFINRDQGSLGLFSQWWLALTLLPFLTLLALLGARSKMRQRQKRFAPLRNRLNEFMKQTGDSSGQTPGARRLTVELTHKWRIKTIQAVFGFVLDVSLMSGITWFWTSSSLIAKSLFILLFLVAFYHLGICAMQIKRLGIYIKNLSTDNLSEIALQLFIAEKLPYALYLRDFYWEYDVRGSSTHTPPRRPQLGVEARELLNLGDIVKSIPVFSLTNWRDYNRVPVAIRVNLVGSDWQFRFSRYAKSAALVILTADYISDGVRYELDWIRDNGAWSKTFLILTERAARQIEEDDPDVLLMARWLVVTESAFRIEVPEELLEYLNGIAVLPEQLQHELNGASQEKHGA